MALAFVISRGLSQKPEALRKVVQDASPVFIFIAAIIPDLDFVFSDYVQHHTITHSLTFWSVAYLPLFVFWRRRALPYFIATLSHLAGDFLLGKPTLFYGITDTQYGLVYDNAIAVLGRDWFVFARSCLDLAAVATFLVIQMNHRFARRIFMSEREAFVGLPVLGILIISILIATGIQDKLLSLRQPHDWPVFIAGYAILAASHIIVILVIIREAQTYAKVSQSEQVAT